MIGGAATGMILISAAALMEWPITTWTLVVAGIVLLSLIAWRDGGMRR